MLKQIRNIMILMVVVMQFSILCCAQKDTAISAEKIMQKRPREDGHCFDFTQVVPKNIVKRINGMWGRAFESSDIDFVMLIIPSLDNNSITEYAAELFTKWEIGKSTQGKKGILILIAMQEQKIKIEIGYDLEEVYTDMYVGQVERDMLKEFLEQADWERGFFGTIEHFIGRIYLAEKKGIIVDEIAAEDDQLRYYSQGAGAKNVFDFGAALNKPIPKVPAELRAYFGAQPTPELAFQRYMEKNTKLIADHTLDLYTESSKVFYSNWRTSSGQMRGEAEWFDGIPYVVKQKGKYAVVLFPCNGDVWEFMMHNPYFFYRSEKGWQIDINTMSRSLIMGARGADWHFMSRLHPYMFAFDDYVLTRELYLPDEGQKAFLGLGYKRNINKQYNAFEIFPAYEGPAKKAGVESGDILLSIDGEKITKQFQDWEMMKRYNPGDVVVVEVLRNGKGKNIKVRLDEVPKKKYPEVKKTGDAWFGFYRGYSQPYERKITGPRTTDSVLYVVKGSPAEKAGLKERDVIFDKDSDFMYDETIKPGDKVTFEVLRDLKKRIKITITAGSYSPGKEGI
ncbi:TPM domain-containing protein [Candidatus Omnitrophota bacterium]